jgi:peptidoglycan/LPS O-acetylase OafA/YrhL
VLSGYLITTLLIRERAFTGRIDVAAGRTYLAGLTLAALGTAVIVRHLVSSGSGLLVGLLSWGPLVAVGRVSYGIYLFHLPLFTLVWSLHLAHLPGTLLEYSLLAGVATGSWFLVERPAQRWVHPRWPRADLDREVASQLAPVGVRVGPA